MSFDVLANLKNLAARGTSSGFDLNTAVFTGSSGGSLFGSNNEIESGLSTRRIINQIEAIVDNNLVTSNRFQFENVQVPLINLSKNQTQIGESLTGLSSALEQNIGIREQQRSQDQSAFESFKNQVSEQLNALGQSVTDASQAAGQKNFLQDFASGLGIGVPVLIVGGIALLLLTRR